MLKINLLGATSLIGSYFIDSNIDYEIISFSRRDKNYLTLDLHNEKTFSNISYENSFLISFAPIWLVKNLFINLKKNNLYKLKALRGVILYSSSSAITKKFAANKFDKNLSKNLISSENTILNICKENSINCIIVRPTIVYGVYKGLNDKNFSVITKIFNKIPLCFIPADTGYRQPIHFSDLSNITFLLLKQLNKNTSKGITCKIIEVGGDEELTYSELLFRLANFEQNKSWKRCKLISIPNKIFYLLISPLLFLKPKLFEEILRMQSDLSGFPKSSYYTGDKLKKFPVRTF